MVILTFTEGLILACLPLFAFVGLFFLFWTRGEGWRESILGAATSWGVLLALITEVLSGPRLITRPVLSLVWLLVGLASFGYSWLTNPPRDSPAQTRNDPADEVPLTRFDGSLITGICLLATLIGINAVLAAPNTWDAMAYHMSRVAQWMTNRDVALYPTFYSAQLFLSPWAEYAILHFDLLFGGDRLVNLVEWSSLCGSIIGVSLIARHLGAGIRGQILAAVACLAIPEGILEASGAMNTYVGTFWIVVTIAYLLRWNEKQSWGSVVGFGAAAGLAIMSKGTAFIFLPLTVLACWWMGSDRAKKLFLVRLPVSLVIVVALNGPLFIRNYRLSGSPLGFSSPLGNDPERAYLNSRYSVSIAYANVIKNLALHLGTPLDSANRQISRLITDSLRGIGIDPNDKASTYRGGFRLNPISSHESMAGNPLELALIALAALMLFGGRREDRNARFFMVGLAGSFILFSAVIRWQPWNSRYHLPLFALGVAAAGAILERRWPPWATRALAVVLLLSALPFVFLNSLRPLGPWKVRSVLRSSRVDSYFEDLHQSLRNSYVDAARAAESLDCHEIGLDSSLDDFDYPLFALLRAGQGEHNVRYAGVRNLTQAFARPDAKPPCAVLCLRCANVPSKWAEYKNVGGRATVIGQIALFSKSGEIPNQATLVLPEPFKPEQLLQLLSQARDSVHGMGLGTTDARLRRAAHDWPDKQAELFARLDGLYSETLTAWRVRDSVDPMRRNGDPVDYSKVDPYQVMAATELLAYWQSTIPVKVRDLNEMANQLYSSWETTLMDLSPSSANTSSACLVRLKTVLSQVWDISQKRGTSAAVEREFDLGSCSCLGDRTRSGDVLARKAFGKFASEAENFTSCVRGDTESFGPPGEILGASDDRSWP
jgi:hypothetical protein